MTAYCGAPTNFLFHTLPITGANSLTFTSLLYLYKGDMELVCKFLNISWKITLLNLDSKYEYKTLSNLRKVNVLKKILFLPVGLIAFSRWSFV